MRRWFAIWLTICAARGAASAQGAFAGLREAQLGTSIGYSFGRYFALLEPAPARWAAFRLGITEGVAQKPRLEADDWGTRLDLLNADAAQPAPASRPDALSEVDKVAYAIGARLAQRVLALNLTARVHAAIASGVQMALDRKPPPSFLDNYGAQLARLWAPVEQPDDSKGGSEPMMKRQGKLGGFARRVRAGKGAQPSRSSRVRVRISGQLADGTEVMAAQTTTMGLAQAIPCLSEALPRMAVGERNQVTCPNAFGPRGVPPRIPPGATVRFDVELLEVQAVQP